MGRPYTRELGELSHTYQWATRVDVAELSEAIQRIRNFPLFSIGSGGSLTAAAYWASMHELETGYPSKYGTPLDLVSLPSVKPYAIGLVSARGNNPDIVNALEFAFLGEAKGLVSVTHSTSSKLSAKAQRYRMADVVSFEPPVKRDGFLATNSLLSSMIHIYRAYCRLSGKDPSLPADIPESDISGEPTGSLTYSIIFAGWARMAAIDLESKLVEGALADVQFADIRNFAHGRHNWIAKRGESTAIVALVTPQWKDLFDRTLALIPSDVRVIRLETANEGPLGAIELVHGVMKLIGKISSLQGIDPGRPTVPLFGRNLYHLKAKGTKSREKKPSFDLLLHRKFGNSTGQQHLSPVNTTKKALKCYLDALRTTHFGGVVFDYDETLCPAENRFGPLPSNVSGALKRILENDVVVGVATGRGKSAGMALRESLDKRFWEKIIVGYYNGGQILRLSEGDPQKGDAMSPQLSSFLDVIRENTQLVQLCEVEERPSQITLNPLENVPQSTLHQLVLELVLEQKMRHISVVLSSHAVDVLAPDVSKHLVVQACLDECQGSRPSSHILRIGDSGSWSGNDFSLLSTCFGLSSANCPVNVAWSWNLAAPGHVGPEATLDYIRAMKFDHGGFSVNVKALVGEIQ